MGEYKDYLVRATAADGAVRAFACTTRDTVEEARRDHNMSPVATAAVGRLLSAGAMMGAMMKNDSDVLTLQIKCSGPIGSLVVTADSKGNVKGYAGNPLVMLPANNLGKLDVGGALDQGVLNVIKDLGLKEPYCGQTILQTGEIAEDLTYYFAVSEQVPSSVGLGVLMEKNNTVKEAGGFIIQLMPFASEEVIGKLEENLSKIQSVTKMLEAGMTPEDILRTVLWGLDVDIKAEMPVRFFCDCTKAKVEKALTSVGKKDLNAMIDDGEDIEVKCHFCNTAYNFTVEELRRLCEAAK